MNVVKQEVDRLNAILKVQITKADYEEKVEKALKDTRRNIQMPGFRKGMVPASLVKKMYGKHVQLDEINKLVVDGLYDYIRDSKLQILGEPLPNEEQQEKINWESDADFEFSYDVAIQPEVDVTLSKKVSAPYYTIEVDEAFIDKQVDSLTSRFGANIEAEEIVDEELVSADFVECDEKGNPVENGHTKQSAMLLLKVVPAEARKKFIGKKRGDSVVFNPMKEIGHEYEVLQLLSLKHENTREVNASYKLTIVDIKSFKKAEINQELFDSSFGEGTVSNEQEFRAKIKENMQQRFAINSDYKFLADFRKQLMDSTAVDLPEAFLKRWLVAANKEKNVSAEEIEKDLPGFFVDLKWQLIKGHFVKQENMTVSEEEFKVAAREFARMQFQQFGYYNPADEDLDHWAVEIAKNQEEAKRIIDIELDKKMVAFFKSAVKLEGKAVSFEDFNKMIEQ